MKLGNSSKLESPFELLAIFLVFETRL